MKTIAIHEKTYELLEKLKEKAKTSSFNKLMLKIIREATETPKSLFGALKYKSKRFTTLFKRRIYNEF